MSLILEDGTGLDNSNTYTTVLEVKAFAALRGVTLPADDALEILLIKAMDFIEAQRVRFSGSKATLLQSLQFPRTGLILDGFLLPENTIPKILRDAQAQLVCDIAAGIDIQPNGTGREVIREKVDVIEREFAATGKGVLEPVLTKACALLEPLFEGGGAWPQLSLIHG